MITQKYAGFRRIICLALCALCLLTAQAGAQPTIARPTDKTMAKLAEIVAPDVVDGFLPVFMHCKNSKKMVAFTIDDCNQADNLRAIIKLFKKYGGKATIFPIGENLEFLGGILKDAWEDGFEIENHTWNHSGLYYEDDEGLVYQITAQNRAVSEALGVDYQMHFLRPRGGDNRYDQRTHAYLRQIGYYGIAYWSKVGLFTSAKDLAKNTQSGDVFLYHTTKADLEQLEDLVPRLYKAGYSFVTLNTLFGLPANETARLSDASDPEPLAPYTRFNQTLHPEDYLHDVYLVQERLSELGFLNSSYNGYYGAKTIAAVRAFQKSRGLTADGICGRDTWAALFN